MASWNDIPPFENLGHGILRLDMAPDDGCTSCGHWKWDYAVVNTTQRHDLLTDKPIKTWSVKSDCLKCGITTIWSADPDEGYPTTK
jgi:hypothetical protein